MQWKVLAALHATQTYFSVAMWRSFEVDSWRLQFDRHTSKDKDRGGEGGEWTQCAAQSDTLH